MRSWIIALVFLALLALLTIGWLLVFPQPPELLFDFYMDACLTFLQVSSTIICFPFVRHISRGRLGVLLFLTECIFFSIAGVMIWNFVAIYSTAGTDCLMIDSMFFTKRPWFLFLVYLFARLILLSIILRSVRN